MAIQHRNITVSGRVQGVFFRAHAQQQAEQLGLTGFARNEPDGSVYMEAEGEPEQLDAFESWCWQGSPHAQVEDVTSIEDKPIGYETFETK